MDNGDLLKRLLLLSVFALLLLSAAVIAAPAANGTDSEAAAHDLTVASRRSDGWQTTASNYSPETAIDDIDDWSTLSNESDDEQSDEDSLEIADSIESSVEEDSSETETLHGDNMFVLSFERYNATAASAEDETETDEEDEDNFVIRLTRALKDINFGRLPKTIVLNQKEVIEHTHIDEEKFLLPVDKGGFAEHSHHPPGRHVHESPLQFLPPPDVDDAIPFPPARHDHDGPLIPPSWRPRPQPLSGGTIEIGGHRAPEAFVQSSCCNNPGKVIVSF